jgi:hypothetical protein
MLPYEQETMCAEFLRMPEAERLGLPRLVHLLMPVGRTMKDVDIVGLGSDEQKIVCQVTFSDLELSSEKLAALRKYDCGHQLIYFCNAKEATDDGHIRVVPLTDVFNEFTATATGKKWMATLKPSDFV